MLENRLFYLASLLGAIIFHCYYTGWVSWFVLVAALCLPLFSLAFSLPQMLRIRLSCTLPSVCNRGDEAILTLKNDARSILPMPLCRIRYYCEDVMAGNCQTGELRLAAWHQFPIALSTAHCGAYRCGVERARVLDYLGLFSFQIRLPQPCTLFVVPGEAAPEPLPNLSQFQSKSYRPKHGGGFSEIHDMRPYRPGDSMRDIHWKLSAKTDRLIVREAQEPNRGQTLLTLDLAGSRTQIDRKLDTLCWLSRWLLRHEVKHNVFWLSPQSLEPETAVISSEEALQALVAQLLQTQLSPDVPSVAARQFPNADWRYHITAQQEGGGL